MSSFDKNKFRFKETFTNTTGKTSGSGFIGVILGLLAAIAFAATMVGYFLEISYTVEVMEEILKLVGAAAILLGVRKVTPNIHIGNTDKSNINTNISEGNYSADSVTETSNKG
jgi:hypothetical protein